MTFAPNFIACIKPHVRHWHTKQFAIVFGNFVLFNQSVFIDVDCSFLLHILNCVWIIPVNSTFKKNA